MFGNSPPPAQGGFGFGAAPTAPFGGGFGSSQQPAAAPAGGFGSSTAFAAPASFGAPTPSSTTSFGAPFGSSSNTFGAPASFQQPQQQQQTTFGGGFGTSAVGGFGSNPYGSPAPAPGGFGQPQPQQTTFGAPANSSNIFGAPFGSTPQSQQQQQQQQQQVISVPNPFGPPSGTPAPALSFGMSSNIISAPTSGGGMSFAAPALTFGDSSSTQSRAGSFPSAPFGSAVTSTSPAAPFGSSQPLAAPFGSAPFGAPPASSGGMTFSGSHNRQTSTGSVEMGSSESPTPASAFGSTFHTTNVTMDSGSGNLSPIPEDSMGDPFSAGYTADGQAVSSFATGGNNNGGSANDDGGGGELSEDDKLARLKAKIEAKKKKLLDRQMRKQQDISSPPPNSDHQQQQQQQAKDRNHRRNRSPSISPVVLNANDDISANNISGNQSRAERNAIRFAGSTNASTQAHLPSELRGKTETRKTTSAVTSAVGGESNREYLADAKSLIGTCEYMCPDEELLRRERENDIQLLEIPDPGGIHPPSWTLRNTVVKRFRRSAADYKLDIPEWVRPPDVLEEVCAYLEEWVMERDRQGPDRRFPQNGTPNSMDVYQFIWDRTRMIRKDFILQNYVGTGGKCDARAVRCHERIARWHLLCEHQLSHINEFAVMQSQQNIQELGQAMKTLNQYYDDSLGRATVEVPDEEGRETRTNIGSFSHGCKSDVVQGGNPVDYDGSPLNNSANSSLVSSRLIGKSLVDSPTRGTAEAEMRGLYILLTMDNDGGMEVMRYSARLYRERPEIYNSKLVQLALNIFKAKKDYNYVRFFEYIRDPKTPYLYACICFKHVALMRKLALRVMSKTYGARKKDTGEAIYDAYPLKKLAQVLCFEDVDEARAACKHYNITVKETKIRSSSSGQVGSAEIIFWRLTDFKEPRDPEKGTIIPLRPKKMIKYIESKLNGATRLGVCRGEVSGEGASLSPTQSTATPVSIIPPNDQSAASPANSETERINRIMRQQQEEAEAKRIEEERKAKEKEKLARAEAERIRRKLDEEKRLEHQKQEEAKRRATELKMEEERQRMKEQKERERQERAEKAALEAQRLREEERVRKLEQEARIKAEAEEEERLKLEALRREEESKQQEILAEQELRRQEEVERVRKEQEKQRLEALRLQEEERKKREVLARKAARELEQRVDYARKFLLLRRWRQTLPRHVAAKKSIGESLKRIDPTFSISSPLTGNFIRRELEVSHSMEHSVKDIPERMDTRKILNRVLSKDTLPLDVASMLMEVVCGDDELIEHVRSRPFAGGGPGSTKITFLFKVAVILPEPEGLEEDSMYESIHTWLDRRLEYEKVDTVRSVDGTHTYEFRVLFTKADSWGGPIRCDAAVFVIPPSLCSGDWTNSRKVEAISSAFDCIDQETPRVAYILAERFDKEFYQEANRFLAACLSSTTEEFPVVFPTTVSETALEGSLVSSLKALVNVLTREFPPVVEQVSVAKMVSKCISDTLWRTSCYDSLETTRATLVALNKDLHGEGLSVEEMWSSWPVDDFADEDGLVRNYFGSGLHLPTSWTSQVFRDTVSKKIMDLHQILQKSVPFAVGQLISGSPLDVQLECDEMLERRQYRKCIQRAFQCRADEEVCYLPKGTAEVIVKRTIQMILGTEGRTGTDVPLNVAYSMDDESAEEEEEEVAETGPLYQGERKADDVEASGDAGVFKRAQDIFEASRTISPPPLPGMKSPLTNIKSPPLQSTPPPPGVSSINKRNWMGMSANDDSVGFPSIATPSNTDGAGLDPSSTATGSQNKRRREVSHSAPRSRDEIESSVFTKKLKALLNGEATVDMEVGNTTLARLVCDTPLLSAIDQLDP